MLFDKYKNIKTGKIIEVKAGSKMTKQWVPVLDDIKKEPPAAKPVKSKYVVDENIPVKEKINNDVKNDKNVATTAGVDLLIKNLEKNSKSKNNSFSSYKELVQNADRTIPAFVKNKEYCFDGVNWIKK